MPATPAKNQLLARALALAALGALGVSAGVGSTACGAAQADVAEVCAGPGTCGAGRACVFGRCRAADVPAAPTDAARLQLEPTDVALVSSDGPNGGGPDLPDVVTLGRERDGSAAVLLRFSAPRIDARKIASAYVVFEPIDGAPLPARPVAVEAARIVDVWSGRGASWARRPHTTIPRAAGFVGANGRVRIDVTELVRDWWRQLPDDHGIALSVKGDDAFGATLGLGGLERGPVLEVYVR